ncbi:hypothetical protein LENED_005728 [Lentinula edodes]|uniref:Uncharacterized protein n=1 Tax=Lentinula edodes TaxID=5353 RepID=A0A1Q3E9S3_LENED|nr:hypothetical protein LENED_005728 [Lentinula edodes]
MLKDAYGSLSSQLGVLLLSPNLLMPGNYYDVNAAPHGLKWSFTSTDSTSVETNRVLVDTARELFLRSILDLQNAGEDPIVVLEALKTAEPNRRAITLNESGESTVHIDEHGHLVEASPPPDSATEALEGLKEVERGSADEGTSSPVGGLVDLFRTTGQSRPFRFN